MATVMPFTGDIAVRTRADGFAERYPRSTGPHCQVVVMSVAVDSEIVEDLHHRPTFLVGPLLDEGAADPHPGYVQVAETPGGELAGTSSSCRTLAPSERCEARSVRPARDVLP
jgi:hypothetical protein